MNIVMIHGAGSTSASFNFISGLIDGTHVFISFEYEDSVGFSANLENMYEKLKDKEEIFFIGHSFGGVYASHLAHLLQDRVLGAVTLSTPYGGSEAADILKHWYPARVLQDSQTRSTVIRELKKIDLITRWPHWTAIVGTRGRSPLIKEPNDGVVTVKSMTSHPHPKIIKVDLNHFEILISYHVVGIIQDEINRAEK